ncbi:ABC transporter substrate-binding protein [Pseudonocardia dioxanivorans]|uniref:ABC transporter substrate-binding protein n=1 Tax=Pseudonocardia dioxanivorans TaxID=240495 RepID=UPI000CD2F369|nr:ABC transporter substrate-binding protein [Pseudonocardia dioxanivorans]
MSPRSTRSGALSKLVATTAATVVAACALAACGTSDDAAATKTSLSIALPGAIESIDPSKANATRTTVVAVASLYSTLVQYDAKGGLVGDLAESWEQTAPDTWKFRLRPGITFSDGSAFTAEDVVFSVERIRDPATASILASKFSDLVSVTAEGDDVVAFTTKGPKVNLPAELRSVFVLDSEWAKTHDPAKEANGTGPFTLAAYNPQAATELKARPDYHGTAAGFQNVTLTVLTDEATRMSALQTGDVDVVFGLEPKSIEHLRSDDSLDVGATPSTRTIFVQFDATKAPFDDLRVRQALNYAVDKKAIADSILLGTVEPSPGQLFNDLYPSYSPALSAFPYDPDKARALLSEAGYPNGFTTEFLTSNGSQLADVSISQAVAAQLAEVGVTATLAPTPYVQYLERTNAGRNPGGLTYRSYGGGSSDPSGQLRAFLPGAVSSYWTNDEFAAAVKEGLAAPTPEAQAASYRRAFEIMNADASSLFLFPSPQTYAISKAVKAELRTDEWVFPNTFTPAT